MWRRPDLLGDGQAAFWRGRFAQARDLWEAEGLIARGARRDTIQGLCDIASGFLRCEEGVQYSAERLLRKGLSRLTDSPDWFEGVAISDVRGAAELLQSALKNGQPADPRALVQHPAA